LEIRAPIPIELLISAQVNGIFERKYFSENFAFPAFDYFAIPVRKLPAATAGPGNKPTKPTGLKFPGRTYFSFLRRASTKIPAIFNLSF
jgi:hypothetical protein